MKNNPSKERRTETRGTVRPVRNSVSPRKCSLYLKALADTDRLQLIRALSEREQCVSDLAALLDLAIGNVSHHLKILRRHGFVESTRSGKQVIYSLSPCFLNSRSPKRTCLQLGCCRIELEGGLRPSRVGR